MRRKSAGAKLAAVVGAAAVAFTAFSPAAAAASGDQSRASARFLSGSGGGVNFDKVAALEGVSVKRTGNEEAVKEANPLKGSLLEQQLANQANGVTIPIGDSVELGALNQYAKASPRAKAVAASGAVADGGAINTTASKQYPSDATLDLTKFLPESLPEQLRQNLPDEVADQLEGQAPELSLELGAISAVAAGNAQSTDELATKCADLSEPTQCRDYNIAGADLTLKLPALQTLFDQLKPLEDTLKGKETTNLQSVCEGIPDQAPEPVAQTCEQLNEASTNAITVTATPPNLHKILDSATQSATGQGLQIDLTDGTVVLDLEKFLQSLGLDLNNLPPNTELIQHVAKALAAKLPDALNTTLTEVSKAVNEQMGKAGIKVTIAGQTQKLSGSQVTKNLDPLIEHLSSQAQNLTDQLQKAFEPGLEQLSALEQLLQVRVNVQDSPADGVFQETAVQIKLLEGALPSGGGLASMAKNASALQINLARARVGAQLGEKQPDQPAKDTPAKNEPDKAAPLPNTGASTLDLPFLLLGLGLVTGGLWIIAYGRAERSDS